MNNLELDIDDISFKVYKIQNKIMDFSLKEETNNIPFFYGRMEITDVFSLLNTLSFIRYHNNKNKFVHYAEAALTPIQKRYYSGSISIDTNKIDIETITCPRFYTHKIDIYYDHTYLDSILENITDKILNKI